MSVSLNLADSVKRNSVDCAALISYFKRIRSVFRKMNIVERHMKDLICDSIVISKLEIPLAELGVPPDSTQEFVDWLHASGMLRS
jgi:hypothetical protein